MFKKLICIYLVLQTFSIFAACDDSYLPKQEVNLESIHSKLMSSEPVDSLGKIFDRVENLLVETLVQKELSMLGDVSQTKLSELSKGAKESARLLIIESSPFFREAASKVLNKHAKSPSEIETIMQRYSWDSSLKEQLIEELYLEYMQTMSSKNQRMYIETLESYEMQNSEPWSDNDWFKNGLIQHETKIVGDFNKKNKRRLVVFLEDYLDKLFTQSSQNHFLSGFWNNHFQNLVEKNRNIEKVLVPSVLETSFESIQKKIEALQPDSSPKSSYKFAAKVFVASNALLFTAATYLTALKDPVINGVISVKLSLLLSMATTVIKNRYEESFGPIFKPNRGSLFYKSFFKDENLSELTLAELVSLKKIARETLKKSPRKLKKLNAKIDSFINNKNFELLN